MSIQTSDSALLLTKGEQAGLATAAGLYGSVGTLTISGAGNTNLSASGPVNTNTITVGAGSGVYTATISLLHAGAIAGQIYELGISLPASANPTVQI